MSKELIVVIVVVVVFSIAAVLSYFTTPRGIDGKIDKENILRH
jgi:hypothetical protein